MKSASSHSAKQANVKSKSTSTESKTDWARLKSVAAKANLTKEHPEAEVQHIVRAIVRRGLQPIPSKASISLRVDQDVLEWVKV